MYKTRLQELCQRRSWSLPEYANSREGPDHNPRFTSTATVNGLSFQAPLSCRTAKEAQNNAAKLALDHFSQPMPPSSPQPQPQLQPQPPNPNSSPFSLPHAPSLPPPFSLPHAPSLPGYSFTQPSVSGFPLPHLSSTTPPSSSGSTVPSTDVVNILPTIRLLQPSLQEACQTSQISSPVAAVREIAIAGDEKSDLNMLRLYKNQLQCYAQKGNLDLPVYSSEWEGPPHALRFKSKVTLNGQTYESPEFFSTLKDAEHAAAKVALMSLLPGGAQEDDPGLYKNLLQELSQKEGFRLPVYSTQKAGQAHAPIFVSEVDVQGELFTGQEAKSKKQAEISAAKVAYMTLKERKGNSNQSSSFPLSAHQGQAPEFSSAHSEPIVTTGLQHHANPKSPVKSSYGLVTLKQSDKDKEPVMVTSKTGSASSGSTNDRGEDPSSSNDQCAPSLSNCTNVVTDTSDMPSAAVGTPSRKRKVIVYSRKTNVDIAEGGTLLPISDDNYVAYSYS